MGGGSHRGRPVPERATVPVGDVAAAFVVVFLAELGRQDAAGGAHHRWPYPAGRVLAVLGGRDRGAPDDLGHVGALVSRALPDRPSPSAPVCCSSGSPSGPGASPTRTTSWTIRPRPEPGSLGVATAFFVAELGDKTMLTTAGLAADRGAVPVWIGSFAAMLSATALAVLAGRTLDPAVATQCCCAASVPPPSRSSASPRSRPPDRVPMMGRCSTGCSSTTLSTTTSSDAHRSAPEHLALAEAAHERGELVMAGALADPADRALLVFRADDAGAAEAFAARRPLRARGPGAVVAGPRPWTVVIGG